MQIPSGLHELSERARVLWVEAIEIWRSGGWAMIAIAAVAFTLFSIGLNVHFRLRSKGFRKLPEKTWRKWVDDPTKRRGPIGAVLETVMNGRTLADISAAFEQVRMSEIVPFERDLRLMRICVSAAPLIGLLGTVTGMLATFGALGSGAGGDKTMGMVADGISTALITTETGLVVALPGLFFQYQLARKCEGYKAFLAHMETVCTQLRYHKLQKPEAAA